MKKIPLRIFSAVLILACLAGLGLSWLNFRQAMACKTHWEETGAEAAASFQLLEDGINQLKDNEKAYVEGVNAYEDGLEDYAEGEKQLQEGGAKLGSGQAEYDEGAAQLAAGKQAYQEGLEELNAAKAQLEQGKQELAQGEAELEAGKARLAAGEAELEAHRQEYEEGKAQIAEAEPLYQTALEGRRQIEDLKQKQAYYESIGLSSKAMELSFEIAALEAAYAANLGGNSIDGLMQQIEEGKAKIAAYEAGMAEVEAGRQEVAAGEAKLEEGRAKIAEGERQIAEGEAKLADAKRQLDEGEAKLAAARGQLNKGYADYAKGQKDLEDGAKALADGLAQLGQYEGGEQQVADGLNMVLATDTYYNAAGEELVTPIASRLGENFSYWRTDADGNYVFLNGERNLDLDKAMQVVKAGRDFLADTTQVVTDEITSRIEALIVVAAACVLGILGGVLGLFGKRLGAMIPAILSTAAAGAAVALLLVNGTENPMSVIAGTGNTQRILIGAAAVACAALVTVIAAALTKNAVKAEVPGAEA